MIELEEELIEALGDLIHMLDHYARHNQGRDNHMDAITHSPTLTVARGVHQRAVAAAKGDKADA